MNTTEAITTIKKYLYKDEYEKEEVINAIKSIKNDEASIKMLIPSINNHFKNMEKVCINFYNILNKNINVEYRKLQAIKNVPYRNESNIYIDVELITLLNPSFELIKYLLDWEKVSYLIKYILKDKIINESLIDNYFNIFLTSYAKFYKNPNLFGNKDKKFDEYVLKNKFYDLYNYYEDYDNYSTIVGLYGEYLEYLKLLEKNDEVIWVSRDCGDIFGYDFLTYDKGRDFANVYEVKGTIYAKNLDKFKISQNEYNKYVYFNNNYGSIRILDQIDNVLLKPNSIVEEHDYYYSTTDKKDYMYNTKTKKKKRVLRTGNQLKIYS